MYADWGIDYLKYDLCSFIPDVMEKQAPNDKAEQMRIMFKAYEKMGNALKATGGPSFSRYASMAGTRRGSGRRRLAATPGGRPATFRPTGTASTRS